MEGGREEGRRSSAASTFSPARARFVLTLPCPLLLPPPHPTLSLPGRRFALEKCVRERTNLGSWGLGWKEGGKRDSHRCHKGKRPPSLPLFLSFSVSIAGLRESLPSFFLRLTLEEAAYHGRGTTVPSMGPFQGARRAAVALYLSFFLRSLFCLEGVEWSCCWSLKWPQGRKKRGST